MHFGDYYGGTMDMKFYYYDKKEAIKNKCYVDISVNSNLKYILKMMIGSILMVFLILLAATAGAVFFASKTMFGSLFSAILPILLFICMIILICKINEKRNNHLLWMYRAFLKNSDGIYMIELTDQDKIMVRTNYSADIYIFYKEIFEKQRNGIITKLDDLKLINETHKQFKCQYIENDQVKTINIDKGYVDIREVFQ